jgi:hypothetical protein
MVFLSLSHAVPSEPFPVGLAVVINHPQPALNGGTSQRNTL